MLRSMYSGISGMKNFQTKLDVIGNNIANVNTFGFKKGRVNFKDMISQTVAGASSPSATLGGVNAKQVGLGSTLAAIDTIHTQGSLQTTGRGLDLAISGDGYFVVAPNQAAGTTFENMDKNFTRAGNFYLDTQGNLVNSDGMYLQGYKLDTETGAIVMDGGNRTLGIINIPTNAQSYSISDKGEVQYVDAAGNLTYAGQVIIAKFPNAEGLEKAGSNLFAESNNSGAAQASAPYEDGAGSVVAGALEMSNVDLSEEFTEMIVTQRGFQANTRIITTSDEILQELVNLKR
ncbi:flagellar basal body rod protein FlgG [Robertmurraya yapensis]|uniref:Flagellar hook protein FlgE n=1 Tax=Bacillus yapensis TaxID=2492960 RepID=A0A431WJN4_9BACI|nr:flagellar basal body rod protein FlgG [Bacillus yapensis]RTR35585.1 flagellar basal body rod protein FlgG [Bacillus yapensis]TKS98386.1 flagellar basal body rod protein FlgG [Bacillus yapensis]